MNNILKFHLYCLDDVKVSINASLFSFILYTCTESSDYDPSMVPNQISFSISNDGIDQCFNVRIIDDDIPEDNENFMLMFDTPVDAEAVNPQITLTPRMLDVDIIDNDEGEQFNITILIGEQFNITILIVTSIHIQ